MRRKLLDIVVCPTCRGSFELDVYATADALEVIEGALRCRGCAATYPVIGGVPRLLSAALLARMRRRYPAFFAAHPEFLRDQDDAGHALADTLESFTRQRLDFPPPGPGLAGQWR